MKRWPASSALLLAACLSSHQAGSPDAAPSRPDARSSAPDASGDASRTDAIATDAGPPLSPGEVRCTDGEVCPIGFDCCPNIGCVPHEEISTSQCLACDDDSDCDARATPGVCCEGPYAIGGGVRWQCVTDAMTCFERVCPPGEDCLRLREDETVPLGEVECNSGWLGFRTCDFGQACCRAIDSSEMCTERTASYPSGEVCSECNVDADCARLGIGEQCCSVHNPAGYIGRRCRSAADDCWDG